MDVGGGDALHKIWEIKTLVISDDVRFEPMTFNLCRNFLSEHLLFNLLFDLFRHVNVSTVQLAKIPHPTLSQQAIQGHGHWIYKGTEEWNGNDLKGGKLNRVELLILVEILFRLWEKNKLQYLTGYCRTIYEHSMQKKESINDFLSLTLRSTTSNPDSWTHLKHSKATLRGREKGKTHLSC